MMFGFACSETPELMPAPITYAQQLAMKLSAVRKSGELDWLRPDGKSQVSVQYGEDGSVERIDTVVVSTSMPTASRSKTCVRPSSSVSSARPSLRGSSIGIRSFMSTRPAALLWAARRRTAA